MVKLWQKKQMQMDVAPWWYKCRQCIIMWPLCSSVLFGYLLRRFSCFEFDHWHWMGLQCKNAASEGHLWTMPCQVTTLQCIVWTFGETGRRGVNCFHRWVGLHCKNATSATFLWHLPRGGLFSSSREQCLVKCRVHHLAAVCQAIVLHSTV